MYVSVAKAAFVVISSCGISRVYCKYIIEPHTRLRGTPDLIYFDSENA